VERTRTESEAFMELGKQYWLYGKGS